jgi:hypothetical protein
MLGVESVTAGSWIPWPLNSTICGLFGALSVRVKAPVLVPAAVGAKVTLTTQLVVGCKGAVQLLVWAKAPLATMLVKVKAAVPVLVTVIACGLLVVPTD